LPDPGIALWQPGEDLRNRRVLVQAEQGLGDTLQYVRFIPDLVAQCAEVRLHVQAPLVDFLRRQLPLQRVGVLGGEVTGDALQRRIALLSLPLAMRKVEESAWAPRGAYLHADAVRRAAWQARLPPGVVRVGVTWRGSPGHRQDHNRSIPLATLAPWIDALGAAGVAVIALQKDVSDEERAWLEHYPHVHLLDEELADFDDTAAVIDTLDHLVTVDTAVAHLAGAMARPVTILLAFAPDWRWGIEHDRSTLYPTVRLLRQGAIDDWSSVIDVLAAGVAGRDHRPA
jgi:hypothetical protein